MGRAKNSGSAYAGPWQVKGVTPETRESVRRAARKAGLPIGEWVNQVLHRAAVEALTGQEQLPAKRLEDQLAEISGKLDDLQRPFWKRFFGTRPH